MPHLKRGAIRDFMNIMGIDKRHKNWHDTDKIFTFDNGSQIEFFSADNPHKMRGSRRDWIFINECNNVDYGSYKQLAIRAKVATILDWNPEAKFWAHKKVVPGPKCWFNISTHWDNQHLEQKN